MSTAHRKKATAKTDLVYGLGKTGMSVARYLKQKGENAIFYDSREDAPGQEEIRNLLPEQEVFLGEAKTKMLNGVRRVIVSPGVPDSDPLLQKARNLNIEIASDIELFVNELDAPIVAVTGSNGKSTVATLLSLMCDAAGFTALAGANLGEPVLDMLQKETPDCYIIELSSFQLQRLPSLPAEVAAVLNVSADHLDWHSSEAEYRAAKYRIFREAIAVVFNREDDSAAECVPANIPYINFGLDEPGEGGYGIRLDEGVKFLARGNQLLLAVDDLALVGRHNWANALAALAMGQLMGLELAPMLQVLVEFPGLPHRMQFVDSINGANYINDSKATNVAAAIASVESVDGLVVLIAGGEGKGGDFTSLANSVHQHLRHAVLIGEDGPAIGEAFEGLLKVHHAGSMHDAVVAASKLAQFGDTVLLAPACASFDQFQNFQERGREFCREVEALHR